MLAIAGLVLAIVFIAVPALQRNSRNTQRRSDLANLRAQFDTWTSNNNGKLPSTDAHLESIVGSTGWGHYNGNDDRPLAANVTVGDDSTAQTPGEYRIHMTTDTNKATQAALDTAAANLIAPGRQELHIWLQKACGRNILTNGNDKDITATADDKYAAGDIVLSNARAVAFVYQIEGEDNARCEDNT